MYDDKAYCIFFCAICIGLQYAISNLYISQYRCVANYTIFGWQNMKN